MQERRKYTRKDILFYSRISEMKTGRMIGNLLNITPQGAMVLSARQIEPNITIELRIELPEGFATKSDLVIKALSLWCQPDINPEYYDTGFKFLDISPENVLIIQRLVQEYGFQGRPPG